MSWYWSTLICGLVAPWLTIGASIRIAFEEGGLTSGFGVWFGSCIITVPLMFLFAWVGRLFLA